MTKSKSLNTGSAVIGVIIIFALIFGIVFLSKKLTNTNNQSLLNSDGNIQIFKKDSGVNTKKVNTTIKVINDNNYKYGNLNENFNTYFKDKLNRDQEDDVKIEKEGSSLTFQVVNRLIFSTINNQGQSVAIDEKDHSSLNFNNIKTISSPESKNNRIRYSEIYNKNNATVDIDYSIESNKLLEEIIINQPLGIPTIYQKIKLNNVYLKIEGPQINFYQSNTNKLLWFIPRPKIYEKNNPSSYVYGAQIEFKCIDGVKDHEENSKPLPECLNLILINTLNNEGIRWILDPKRNYPVVIDPDFQIDSGDTSGSWVSSDSSNFTVSQSTTIKHEGTGAVKITATNTACWSTDGSTCNSACLYGNRTTTTTYTTCNGPYNCTINEGYWNGSSCNYSSYSTYNGGSGCTTGGLCH